jgi:hypothetical protein
LLSCWENNNFEIYDGNVIGYRALRLRNSAALGAWDPL